MIVHADATNLHKMRQKFIRGCLTEVSDNEWIRLNIGDQLLLLLKNVLKILKVGLGVLLVHKFFNQLLFRQLRKAFEVLPKFFVAQNGADRFWKNSNCSNGWQQLNISVVIRLKDVVKLIHYSFEQRNMGVLVTLEVVAYLLDYAPK